MKVSFYIVVERNDYVMTLRYFRKTVDKFYGFQEFHLFLYLSGETPVILTKNLPKTDWSEKPRLSAISFIPISVLSSKRFASAQSSSDT